MSEALFLFDPVQTLKPVYIMKFKLASLLAVVHDAR